MFALLAAVCWFLVSVGVADVGPVSLAWLGACLLALQFAFGSAVPGWPGRRS